MVALGCGGEQGVGRGKGEEARSGRQRAALHELDCTLGWPRRDNEWLVHYPSVQQVGTTAARQPHLAALLLLPSAQLQHDGSICRCSGLPVLLRAWSQELHLPTQHPLHLLLLQW